MYECVCACARTFATFVYCCCAIKCAYFQCKNSKKAIQLLNQLNSNTIRFCTHCRHAIKAAKAVKAVGILHCADFRSNFCYLFVNKWDFSNKSLASCCFALLLFGFYGCCCYCWQHKSVHWQSSASSKQFCVRNFHLLCFYCRILLPPATCCTAMWAFNKKFLAEKCWLLLFYHCALLLFHIRLLHDFFCDIWNQFFWL